MQWQYQVQQGFLRRNLSLAVTSHQEVHSIFIVSCRLHTIDGCSNTVGVSGNLCWTRASGTDGNKRTLMLKPWYGLGLAGGQGHEDAV